MGVTVELHPQFRFDTLDEADYLEARARGLGAEFLDAVATALERIALAPLEQPPWRLKNVPAVVRWTKVGKFDAKIIFVLEPPRLVILAIRGDAQHPTRWLSRLADL